MGDNKKLIMRQKELDQLVLDHQEVSRERAISEDKLRARIAELEKENQRLEIARQAEEEKTASALQELDIGRQRLFESCKLVGRALKKLGAEPAQLDKDGELSALNSWMSNAAVSLSSCVLQFASRCSRVACETLCAALYSNGCSHLSDFGIVIPNLLLNEANLNRTRELVRPAAKAFQLLFWKKRGYEDTISSLAASLAESSARGGQESSSRREDDNTTSQV